MSSREQEQIDQEEFSAGSNENAQVQADAADESQLQQSAGGSLDSEASELNKDNIISDDSGPGGRSLRGNRGDPTAADKQIDSEVADAENAEA